MFCIFPSINRKRSLMSYQSERWQDYQLVIGLISGASPSLETYLIERQAGHARSPVPETCNFDAHCALLRSASKHVIDPHLIVRI
jgi:hypothetical protein